MSRPRHVTMRIFALAGLWLSLSGWAVGQGSEQALERGFQEPPDSAKPRVWWHWMNGNVTKEGITQDLEWMKRVGIGGMQMFDGSLLVPKYVDKRLVWMTPEWKEALRHAAAEAERLGLEMSMAASGGWSESGGPSVKPAEAMKKVVWSETRVEGPRHFTGRLPNPPSVNGVFQGIPRPNPFALGPSQPAPPDPTFYADSVVLAYRLPEGEVRMADLGPKVTSSAGNIDAAALMDGDLNKMVALPLPEGGKPAWIQFEFAAPFRAQAFSLASGNEGMFGPTLPNGEVQVSQDGTNFETIVNLPGTSHSFSSGLPVRTYAFPERAARFYRVLFTPPPANPAASFFPMPPVRAYHLAELEFASGPRVNRWEDKAGFGNAYDYDLVPTPAVPAEQAIARSNVIDLTAKMRADGTLDWQVPAGKWVILRMGYSLTGQKNAPATPEATGYEVDKLSRQHVESYLGYYVGQVAQALGPYFGKSFRYFLMDSWEAGMENWTEEMLSEFRQRRGYDPLPYLPVLTGRVVQSADVSDRFLWDYRRTLADLLAENHYGAAASFLHQRHIGLYAEAMGAGLPTTGDGLQDKGRVDIPMGEFWTLLPGGSPSPEHPADVREAASAAHIYGKTLAAAESFTSAPNIPGWGQSPFYLKPLADYYLAAGINRIVFHTSVHQPFVDQSHRPGITLWMFGQHYTRNITWAEQSRAWNAYLARSSYMLQQGRFVGDLAYYYGEGAPVAVPFWEKVKPEPPLGYNYDTLNTEVLLTRLSVEDGRLVLPDGLSYRVLVLPEPLHRLTLPVLRKIRAWVAAGATVVGPKPTQSPSLAGYPSSDEEIRALAQEVWGDCNGRTIVEHAYGKGKVYWGLPLEEVLARQKTPPDFEYNRPKFDTKLVWIHRQLGDAALYFVANQNARAEDVETRFRVDGKAAELWHPDTGAIEPAAYTIENGRTTVPLHLDPYGSVFVVFRQAATAPSRALPHPASTVLTTLAGPWEVSFPPEGGAPPQVWLDHLISWTAHSDEGVKYFSGTATYTKEIEAPPEWFRSGAKLVLDLGKVKEIAEVAVNGQPLGILWKPPFQADVTAALKPGANRLEIKITNLWPNRLIGDQQPSATKKYTFASYQPYTKDSPLLESGLLGPVTLSAVTSSSGGL